MQDNKNCRDGVVFKAVNGLWLSGLYAVWAGSGAGLVCGAAVGALLVLMGMTGIARAGLEATLLPFFMGVVCGAIAGVVVGAVVGLLAGILASGFGGRRGCRLGTAIAAFTVGSGSAVTTLAPATGPHSPIGKLGATALILLGLLLLFSIVSYGVGNYLYTCLENQDGFFTRWRITLHEHGVDDLTKRERTIATAIAASPVLFTYGYIAVCLVMRSCSF